MEKLMEELKTKLGKEVFNEELAKIVKEQINEEVATRLKAKEVELREKILEEASSSMKHRLRR